MEDLVTKLQSDLNAGFTKSDLERLIGLPYNSLSGIMNGKREIPKLAILKIEKWNAGEKPDPLKIDRTKKKRVPKTTPAAPPQKKDPLMEKLKESKTNTDEGEEKPKPDTENEPRKKPSITDLVALHSKDFINKKNK